MSVNFTPNMKPYNELGCFRVWCQKVLPLVYDDSLSYYELLCKVTNYLNNVIQNVDNLNDNVNELLNAYNQLQSYVNNYFDNLDVQEEINNKLDNMASNGELYEIIRRYTDPIVNEQNEKINVLKARMDTFTSLPDGSTAGDAELADIRVGYNGTVYPSAGDAVREQVRELNSDLVELNGVVLGEYTFSGNDTPLWFQLDLGNGTIDYKIINNSNFDGYIRYNIYDNSNYKIYEGTQFILNANSSITNSLNSNNGFLKMYIVNINKLNISVEITYNGNLVNNVSNLSERVEELQSIDAFIRHTEAKQLIGYVNSDGEIVNQNSGVNRYAVLNNFVSGSGVEFSGYYNGWGVLWGYKEDGTPIQLLNKGTYSNEVVYPSNDIVKIIGWSDTSVKPLSLKYTTTKSDTNTIVVDCNGNGNFTDIISAINYVKSNYDVDNIPVTIFVKNGVYNVSPTTTGNFYAIDKGANKISIIGESRDGVIIRCTCTSQLQGIALNIGGECIIANMSIENLADSSFTIDTYMSGHRPYCLHNDEPPIVSNSPYYTTVKNVKCYSECDVPIGAGLQNNQTQRYENVECIYSENAVIKEQGSLYIHAPFNSEWLGNGVEVVDCVLVSENDYPAFTLKNVSGSQSVGEIKQTFIRNVTCTNGTYEIDIDSFNKSNCCKLNSNSRLNK